MIPELALVPITFVAALVNGALGHGFSSITVPLALVFSTTSRMLNPALVPVEVVINGYVLFLNRQSAPLVLRRVVPVLVGLVPGVVAGAYLLALIDPAWLKLFVFAVLLPPILLQAAGVRRAVGAERIVGVPFGAGVGVLYSLTTISGPPLALMLNNQGLAKREFRAALALIRLAESTLTAVAYAVLGLYTASTAALLAWIVPGVLIGVPLGAFLIRRLEAETFRRICMSFDAWIVGFGLSRVLIEQVPGVGPLAYGIWIAVVLADGCLLWSFFGRRRSSRVLSPRPGIARAVGAAS